MTLYSLIAFCLLIAAYVGTVGFLLWLWRDQHNSHRQEIAALNQARMEETANLLQRIQAPEQATATHAGKTAQPDPLPVDLEDDLEMFRAREERMKALGVIDG